MKKIAFVVFLIFISSSALAGMGHESDLHVSGGISMPSTSTSVFTNPAALVDVRSMQLDLQAGAQNIWDHSIYRAGIQGGNGSFGAAAGIQDYSDASSALAAFYGLAVGTQSFSFGIAGKTGISHSSGSQFNAGLLLQPLQQMHLGVTARGLNGGPGEYGLGIAYSFSSGVDLILDSAVDRHFNQAEFKPGIKVGNSDAALTLSYGTGDKDEFSKDVSIGGVIHFKSKNALELYYNPGNDLSKYYAAVSIGF